jgi:hypothetical protein
MMSYGKPLPYDGRNLLTADLYDVNEAAQLPTADPAEAIRYHAQRGEFKPDTTWVLQPWGQFIVAGASLALFGHDTIPARLPFALAGALTAALLYAVVRARLASTVAAVAAVALLLTNSFWVMHMRQCRYYSLSCLFFLVTLEAYLRWREGRRWGGPIFIGAAWLWFQVDYGSVWPVFVVLGLHALITRTRTLRQTLLTFAGLCAVTVPFCLYYDLIGRARQSGKYIPWSNAIRVTLYQLNQFQLPLVIMPVVLYFLWLKIKNGSDSRSVSLVGLSFAIACALPVWMAVVSPYAYYRYIVPLTPISIIVTAFGIVELARRLPRKKDLRWLAPCAVATATLLFAVTNLPSRPGVIFAFPDQYPRLEYYLSGVIRQEIRFVIDDLTGTGEDDPNRIAVEFLRQRLKPDDEIICNYEDVPLIFYLKNSLVRGGISCFRVNDKVGRVRFAVLRVSAGQHQSIYSRVLKEGLWRQSSTKGLDIAYANYPDPQLHYARLSAGAHPLKIWERVSQ